MVGRDGDGVVGDDLGTADDPVAGQHEVPLPGRRAVGPPEVDQHGLADHGRAHRDQRSTPHAVIVDDAARGAQGPTSREYALTDI